MVDSIIHSLDTAHAPLPVVYENAKTALYNCVNVDECINWADKALALASYARQSHDEELEKLAKRIRARAIRRCGELLKMFDGRPNNNPSGKEGGTQGRDAPPLGRYEAGKNAGLSLDQTKQAVNMANIPEALFESKVEEEKPLSTSQLAELGKREFLSKPKPEAFADSVHLKGDLRRLVEKMDDFYPEYIISAISEEDKQEWRKMIGKIEIWFDKFIVNL